MLVVSKLFSMIPKPAFCSKPHQFMLRFNQYFFSIVFLFCMYNAVNGQPVITYNSVITGLNQPVDFVNAGDGTNRIFIAEQGGTVKVYNSSYTLLGTFLTVTGINTGGEEGLLSIAFHPNYETNGFFWVYYTNNSGNLEVSRYKVSTANPNVADALSKQVVITIPHPVQSNHNGAKLNFGSDGYLYFATGDGGGGGDPSNNAQNGNVLLGKMLRINVSTGTVAPFYTIPTDNPYVTNPNVLDEIWALGLRNPFRWSFDRTTNAMWIGDVGQGEREEINYRAAGSTGGINYGWRCYEGNLPFNTTGCQAQSNYVFPVYDYQNPNPGSASVTGGYVYRGSTYTAMQGYYFAADVYSGNLYKINTAGFTTTVQTGLPTLVAGFGETENGELFAVSLNGNAYSLRTNFPTPVGNFTNGEEKPIIYPSVVTGKTFTIQLPTATTYQQLQIVSSNGSLVQQQTVTGRTGNMEIVLPNHISQGVYFVKLIGSKKLFTGKIVVGK
jgi:glucose/arabinose dehydrogenase